LWGQGEAFGYHIVGGESKIVARMLHPYGSIEFPNRPFFPHSIAPQNQIKLPVGAKHLGDNIGRKTNNFMSKCFALTSRRNLDRDRTFYRSEICGDRT
jgi:hypothetical protein